MAEFWDLYNSKREFLGRTIERGKPFGEGEYYVAVEMWIINTNKELLVTQRHPNKKAGGLWEFSGGGVPTGETTLIAAKRELQEEIGIDVKDNEIKYFVTFLNKNCFMDIFVIQKDIDIAKLKLQPDEVVNAKWVTFDGFEDMCLKGIIVRSVAARFEKYKEELKSFVK